MADLQDDLDGDTICSVCNAEFLDIDDLKLHVTQYHVRKSIENRFCNFCSIVFADIDAYALHIRDVHLNNLKSCKFCTRVYIDQDILLEHEQRHKSVLYFPKLSCSQCDTIFQCKADLENHEYAHHRDCEDGFMLNHCFASLSSFINMSIYKYFEASQHHLSFVCTACGMSTLKSSKYINHLKTNDCRSFTCGECCDVFAKKSKLREHCKTHYRWIENKPSKTPKQCLKCGKYFSFTEINSHLKGCSTLKCSKCPLTFNSVHELAEHTTVHTHKTPVQFCKYCRKPVVGLSALRKHIERSHQHNIHLYKYHCIYCNIIFNHPKVLFGHFFTKHRDIQPYTCKICNETFRIRKKFTLHIKLKHKSVGFVEFDDNFHVYFTDKKSDRNVGSLNENANLAKTIESIDEETLTKEPMPQDSSSNLNEKDETQIGSITTKNSNNDKDNEHQDLENPDNALKNEEIKDEAGSKDSKQTKIEFRQSSEKENEIIDLVDTQDDDNSLVEVKKRNKNINTVSKRPKKKSKLKTDYSSEDSDVPLAEILNKKNKQVHIKMPKKKYRKTGVPRAFICSKCNRNCYTYQNYHQHMSLHKKKICTCIKCFKNFKTTEDLNKHIKSDHSTSALTETLKRILDQRKKVQNECYVSEKFIKTMKKVPVEVSTSQATIARVSAKKFLENFSPETNESRTDITSHISIKPLSGVRTQPFIKLTKYTPDQTVTDRPKLKMPTKYTDENPEEYNVVIKLVHSDSPPSSLKLNNEITITDLSNCNFEDPSKDDGVPEVAHEIMLEETEVKNVKYLKKTIIVKDLLKHDNVRIGHLSPQAPYYKIVKIDQLLKEKKVENKPSNLLLPNGTKLINVNPLAHLLDNKNINKISKFNSNPKQNTKLQDFRGAIVKAMTLLENPMKKRVRKKESKLES